MCGLSLHISTHPSKTLKRLRETADTDLVENRVRVLKEMVANSLYVVDERAVADAVLARAAVRRSVATAELRGQRRRPIRSFRRARQVRSFRLTGGAVTAAHRG
jgi:hypothetical protein